MVDLIGAYSKRLDLADALVRTLDRLGRAQDQSSQPLNVSVKSTGRSQREWRVADRLTDADVRSLVVAFQSGTPKWKLAEQYGISESSVKRLVRKHRADRESSTQAHA